MASEDTAARLARAGLEGDGVNGRLFELLWKRDVLSDSSIALRIPHTIIFKYNAPSHWYFTSVDGTIKRKTKANVNVENIWQEFVKRPSPSGIVAYFVTSAPETRLTSGPVEGEGFAGRSGNPTTIEYFDKSGLEDFLFGRQRVRSDGILQRFVEPKGGSNNMVRAFWSPKVCLVERRVNRWRLSDSHHSIYERAVTFEGPDHQSELQPIRSSALVTQIHEIADSMVQHVASVTHDRMKISRLALNLKVDEKEHLWLLFASSLRLRDELTRCPALEEEEALRLKQRGLPNTPLEQLTMLQVPEHIRRAPTTLHRSAVPVLKMLRCPTCEDKVREDLLVEVSYRVLIEYGELAIQPGQSVAVPAALERLHPRLTLDEYMTCRQDVAFGMKTTAVCEACFLRFSAPQLGPQQRLKSTVELRRDDLAARGEDCGFSELIREALNEEEPFVGTQGLDPTRLRSRRSATLRKICREQAHEEALYEEHDRRQEQAKALRPRAKSCPLLPPDPAGPSRAVQWPPLPVLTAHRASVPAPKGAGPEWNLFRSSRPPLPPPVPRSRIKVPPLLGEPYLRELQQFAAHHGCRAVEVLGPQAAARLFDLAAISGKAPEVDSEPSSSAETSPSTSPSRAGHSDDESDVEIVSDVEVGDLGSVAGKQSPHRGFPSTPTDSATPGLTTPTTRPPSQGEGFSGPFSRPGSRPSTHTSSRGPGSAIGQAPTIQRQAQLRPFSSPQFHRGAGVRGLPRPSSSPQLHSKGQEQPRP